MPATVIRCPGCGAADTSPETPGGVHTCVYCNVRYQLTRGTARTLDASPAAPAAGKGVRIAVGAVAAAVLVLGLVVFVGTTSAPMPASRRGEPVNSVISRAPQVAVAAAPAVKGSAVVNPPVVVKPAPEETAPAVVNPPVVVEPAPEDTAPATAEFQFETSRDSGTALWIYGYVRNTSPFTLGKTKITAVFYDKAGAEIGQSSGYTEDDVIAPDARTHAVILATGAPAGRERIGFEVAAQRPSYLPPLVSGLEVEAVAPRREQFGTWRYAGKVHNKSGQPAKFVKVKVLAFDQNDKLAGHGYTFASADALADGATARFDGSLIDSKTDFKRFEFHVEGRPVR